MLWIESHRTVVARDALVDFGQGLEIPAGWLRDAVTREQVVATHGGPTDRAAPERALSGPPA